MSRSIAGAIGWMLLAAATAVPVDAAQDAPPASARIEGIVVDGNTGAPLSRVVIAIRGTDRRTRTDAGGWFVLDGLSPGTHVLLFERPGYRPARPADVPMLEESGVPVSVGAGEQRRGRLRMYPAAIASGRVVDASGQPVPYALVVPFRRGHGEDGAPVVRDFPGVRTNDLGDFRLTNLDEGRYAFRVAVAQWHAGAQTAVRTLTGYYPGTTDLALAEEVTVERGRETTLPDIVVAPPSAPSAP